MHLSSGMMRLYAETLPIDLQDQLSKTLAYNSDAFARHAPLQQTSVDCRLPKNTEAHFSPAQMTKPARPMVTPTASFRGAMDWGPNGSWPDPKLTADAGNMERREQEGQAPEDTRMDTSANTSPYGAGCVPSETSSSHSRADDYSAFEHDAFAPLHPPTSAAHVINKPADPWAAFRLKAPPPTTSHSFQQQTRSHVANQPAWDHTYANNTQQRY